MSLQGGPELKRRLKGVRLVFKDAGKDWADLYVKLARPRVPVQTGRLRKSLVRKSATQRKATVVAHFTAFFVDKGPKPHTITAKRAPRLVFQAGGRTIFARSVKHRGYRGRPFRARTAREAFTKTSGADRIVDAWNKAA